MLYLLYNKAKVLSIKFIKPKQNFKKTPIKFFYIIYIRKRTQKNAPIS